ncbi:hypothetical protein GCM10008955_33590 [Deinococcus malanensis]|uniref:Uncharacterized protein n=1 Tax=Deinococcus malanensis TaxID=1706855 RepID=A0ABQ2F3I7_9DEIO|nr:hypothetical protein GCM10008955_33590 [Deinococcus malanensis]
MGALPDIPPRMVRQQMGRALQKLGAQTRTHTPCNHFEGFRRFEPVPVPVVEPDGDVLVFRGYPQLALVVSGRGEGDTERFTLVVRLSVRSPLGMHR